MERYLNTKGIENVGQITRKQIMGFINHLSEGHSDSYIWYRLVSLRRYFSFLEKQGLLFISPISSFKLPKKPIHHYSTLKQTEIERVLDGIKPTSPFLIRGKAMLELAYSSALRPGEIIRLKLSEIDFIKKRLFIRQSKNRKDRIVPVGNTPLFWMREYIKEVRPKYAKQYDELFISHKTGKPLTIFGLYRAIQDALQRSNLPPITPYSMRSTAATALLDNGMGLSFISALLGHANLTTTKLYLQTDMKSLRTKLALHHPRNSFRKEETQHDY